MTEGGTWLLRFRSAENSEKSLAFYGTPLVDSPFETTPPDLIAYSITTINDALSDDHRNSVTAEALEIVKVYAAIRYAARTNHIVTLPIPNEEKHVI